MPIFLLETADQFERVPPETKTSASTKSEAASEREKVRVAVSPALRVEVSDERVMVGLRVSMARLMLLLASRPSLLVLPAESENVPDATEIRPLLVLSAAGVKVAV